MAQISKAVVDSNLRNQIFDFLFNGGEEHLEGQFVKINDRQYGVLIHDLNGVERYCRVGVIVAEEREDCTAEELMKSEIADYNGKQEKKAQKKAESAAKAAADKKRREEEQKGK